MMKFKNFLLGTLAMLTALLLVGCDEKDNPVNPSPDKISMDIKMDTSTLELSIGSSATRQATSKTKNAQFTYTSSVPSVATVDQKGKVTAVAEGKTTIKVVMTVPGSNKTKSLQYIVKVIPVKAADLKEIDKATPLTLVAAEDGSIAVEFKGGITLEKDIHYTINNGAEQSISKSTVGTATIQVKKGDMVQLYSNNSSLSGNIAKARSRGITRAVDHDQYINIRPSMKTEIFGNVMSLLKGKDNLESADKIEASNAFYGLFEGADKLVNSESRELMLPAKELKDGCYTNMFSGCSSLETAPELPAEKTEDGCYAGMFSGCSKLTTVKILATDFSADHMEGMLEGAGTETELEVVTNPAPEAQKKWEEIKEEVIPENATIVLAVTGVKLDKTAITLKVGDSITLIAEIEPDNAGNQDVEWTSDDQSIATVDMDGKVTAVAEGKTKIRVTTLDGAFIAICEVTVDANVPVASGEAEIEDFGPGSW